MSRNLEEMNKEYTVLCAQAGQAQYNIEVAKLGLAEINVKIKALIEEAASLPKIEESKNE